MPTTPSVPSTIARHLQALGDGVEVDVLGVEGNDLASLVGHGSLLDGGLSCGSSGLTLSGYSNIIDQYISFPFSLTSTILIWPSTYIKSVVLTASHDGSDEGDKSED